MNSFSISQFNCSPLVWMSHSRLMNNEINGLHEKFFRIVYSDKTSSFEELLDKDGYFFIHTRIYKYFRLKCLKFIRTCCQL